MLSRFGSHGGGARRSQATTLPLVLLLSYVGLLCKSQQPSVDTLVKTTSKATRTLTALPVLPSPDSCARICAAGRGGDSARVSSCAVEVEFLVRKGVSILGAELEVLGLGKEEWPRLWVPHQPAFDWEYTLVGR